MEQFDYYRDQTRLSLLAHQILDKVSRQQYSLSLDEYVIYASLYIYVTKFDAANHRFDYTLTAADIKRYLPREIYHKLKKKAWVQKVLFQLEVL